MRGNGGVVHVELQNGRKERVHFVQRLEMKEYNQRNTKGYERRPADENALDEQLHHAKENGSIILARLQHVERRIDRLGRILELLDPLNRFILISYP